MKNTLTTVVMIEMGPSVSNNHIVFISHHEDKDLAFIVLKLGGPALLDMLCKANKLPSSSLAYRMGSGMKQVNSPVTMTPAECMENNLDLETYSSSYAASQKMENWHMQLPVSDCF